MATDVRRVPSTSVQRLAGARATRTPRYNFHVCQRPFEIQPIVCAPVCAGDSVRNVRFEARILTDAIKNQLTGWWAEMYWFYVRFSNLTNADDAKALIVDPAASAGSLPVTANPWTFFDPGPGTGVGINWLYEAMQPIIFSYFRKETEAWNAAHTLIDGIPIAGLVGKSWLDTVVPLGANDVPADVSDYTERWEAYEALRKSKLITMSFAEYLRSQGVAVPAQLEEPVEQFRKPELWRFIRQFAYPANTVTTVGTDPVETRIVSAVSWVVSERIDKTYYCDEPGFVVGVSVVRPKLYRSRQESRADGLLRNGRVWLPDMQVDAPQESLDMLADTGTPTDGPLAINSAYVHDAAGIFVLGDQFRRTRLVGTDTTPLSASPAAADAAIITEYPVEADLDGVFFDSAAGNSVEIDGTASLSITGRRVLSTVT